MLVGESIDCEVHYDGEGEGGRGKDFVVQF